MTFVGFRKNAFSILLTFIAFSLFTPDAYSWRLRCGNVRVDPQMVAAAKKARATITSGCRTRAHNRRIGGASNSLHITGNAIDIRGKSPAACNRMRARMQPLGYCPYFHGGNTRGGGAPHCHVTRCGNARSVARSGIDRRKELYKARRGNRYRARESYGYRSRERSNYRQRRYTARRSYGGRLAQQAAWHRNYYRRYYNRQRNWRLNVFSSY